MGNKAILGALVLLGLLGAGFAFGGPLLDEWKSNLPEDVKAQFEDAFQNRDFETLRALHEQYRPQIDPEDEAQVQSLHESIHNAMEAGDFERAQELRGELHDLLPGNPFGKLGPMGMGGPRLHGMFPPGNCTCPQD